MIQLFNFIQYKPYVAKTLDGISKTKKGARSRFAEAIQCRPGYVTQVLNGSSDLSLEQADLASSFFGHTEEESRYFLILVMHERAGTRQLKQKIAVQIDESREKYLNLKKRFQVQEISDADQLFFYDSWQNLAVLTLLSIARFQNKEALSAHLHLPLKRISEILEFLERSGLMKVKGDRYLPGTHRTHLGKDSPMIARHHTNWRIQAIQSIERPSERDLHYSSVVSLSAKDMHTVKQRLVEVLEEIAQIIAPSPEEKVCSFCVDFFEV